MQSSDPTRRPASGEAIEVPSRHIVSARTNKKKKDIIIKVRQCPSANSGVAIGGAKEEKSTTDAAKRHWAMSCVRAHSRN
jgi:hypothetical protein